MPLFGRTDVAQIRDDGAQFLVWRGTGGHDGSRNTGPDRLENPLVAVRCRPQPRQIRAAHTFGVGPVAIGAAFAEQRSASLNGGGILSGAAGLNASDEQHRRQRTSREQHILTRSYAK
jgi:hypothetical protein